MGVLGNFWERKKGVLRAAHPRTPFQGEYPPGAKSKIFSGVKCLKKKKGGLPSFCNFSTFHFQFSTFPFTIFLLFFSIFTPFPFFPGRSAEISRSEDSGGHSTPTPPPPAWYATVNNLY